MEPADVNVSHLLLCWQETKHRHHQGHGAGEKSSHNKLSAPAGRWQSQPWACVCVCDDLQCWPPPSGLAPVSLNVPLSSTVGNSDVSLDLLWHNRDLAQATERLNWSHKSSNPPKVYQDPQSGSSRLSDHTRTPWRLLRTQARSVGASSADIGCGNGPVAPAGSTWSCACGSDPPVVSLLNQKAI